MRDSRNSCSGGLGEGGEKSDVIGPKRVGGHVGTLVFDRLKGPNRLTELHAAFCVGTASHGCGACNPGELGCREDYSTLRSRPLYRDVGVHPRVVETWQAPAMSRPRCRPRVLEWCQRKWVTGRGRDLIFVHDESDEAISASSRSRRLSSPASG